MTQSNVREDWDRIFGQPDKAKKTGGLYFYRLAVDRIQTGESICDVGCGYTSYLPHLVRRCGPDGSFTGIDFSLVALAASAEWAAPYPNARLLLADLRHLPLPDLCVDRSFCAETLPYLLGDVERGLRELARISKHEVIFSLHTRGTYEIKGTHNEFRGNLVIEHTPGAKPPRRVFERDEITELVQSVGNLRMQECRPFQWKDLFDTRTTGGEWPWYLPAPDTIALYYIIAQKD